MARSNIKNTASAKHLFSLQSDLLVSTRVKILLALLVGLVLSGLSVYIVHDQYISSLTRRVESMNALLDVKSVENIKHLRDQHGQSKALLRQQFQQARSVNDDARYVYLLAVTDTNNLYYLVDSDPTTGEGALYRGRSATRASEELKAAYFTGQSFSEGPRRDQYGSWLTVTTPVHDRRGEVLAMLGMDIPAEIYYRNIALAAAIPALGSLLVAMVFVMTDSVRRRRQEATRMRSELVSIASHELRTPLTGLRWSQEALLKSEQSATNRDALQSMYESTIRLQESIEDILQLANLQAGRSQELMVTSTDIKQIFDGIFATQKLPAAQKDVTLEYSRGWPGKLLINCDSQRLKRVLNNLISNAIKYARPNTAVTVDYEKINGRHVISIRDRGIGIPASEQEKVFAGFYRASNAITHEASGTGMGLYMSRAAIEQHGGKLWLKSEEGKGTTVYIELP